LQGIQGKNVIIECCCKLVFKYDRTVYVRTMNGDGFPWESMNETSNDSTLTLSSRSILPISTGVGKVMIMVVVFARSANGSEEFGLQK